MKARLIFATIIFLTLGLMVGSMEYNKLTGNQTDANKFCVRTDPFNLDAASRMIVNTPRGPYLTIALGITVCTTKNIGKNEAQDIVNSSGVNLGRTFAQTYSAGQDILETQATLENELTSGIRKHSDAISGITRPVVVEFFLIPVATPWPKATPTPTTSGTTA